MSERVLPLRGIAVFEVAARTASFQAAALELNLTPSAVSHQIRLLEDLLGVRLFDRTGRGVTLTPDGADYARSVRQGIRRLRHATSDIKSRGKQAGALDVVSIEAPASFAHGWLLPRLAGFIAAHPAIDVRLDAQGPQLQGDRLPWPALPDAPADLQIVYGDDDLWQDRAARIVTESVQPYCAPAFLARHPIATPADLLPLVLIGSRNYLSWEEWLDLQGVDADRALAQAIQLDPSHLAIAAAASGMGLILESDVLVERERADGRLVAPFPQLARPGLAYWLVAPAPSRMRPATDAVVAWLAAITAGAAPGS